MTKRIFVQERIDNLKFFLKSLGIIRKIPSAADYDKFDMDKFVKDLFGEVNWRYIHDIIDDNEESIIYGYGILFNGKYAFMFRQPEVIWLVNSESYHKPYQYNEDEYAIGFYENEDVLLDVKFANSNLVDLEFFTRNCDRIIDGGISIWDFFSYFKMHGINDDD